jgi:hypothetical protein
MNGRKVVFSLSPSFFFQELNAKWYEGNLLAAAGWRTRFQQRPFL